MFFKGTLSLIKMSPFSGSTAYGDVADLAKFIANFCVASCGLFLKTCGCGGWGRYLEN